MTHAEFDQLLARYDEVLALLKRANSLPLDSLERWGASLTYNEVRPELEALLERYKAEGVT